MNSYSGIINLKNSTIICDDWFQMSNNEYVRLAFCPNNFFPEAVEGFIRLVHDEENNVIFFETDGVLEYISDLYIKVYRDSVMYYTNYFKSKRDPVVVDLYNIQDIFQAFVHIDKFLEKSDLLLPYI